MRRTATTMRLLSALLREPTREHYGYALLKATNMKSGSLYPLLERLEGIGWITGEWEDRVDGRPPRRYYRLTADGQRSAREFLEPTKSRGATVAGAWA